MKSEVKYIIAKIIKTCSCKVTDSSKLKDLSMQNRKQELINEIEKIQPLTVVQKNGLLQDANSWNTVSDVRNSCNRLKI